MIKCKFCDLTKKKVDAHIIPKSFFFEITKNNNILKQRQTNTPPKRKPKGIYDDSIWCQDCEKDYGKWDNDATNILLHNDIINKKESDQTTIINSTPEKINKLRLFFISLLWRASQSNEELYKNVSIGSFTEEAKKILKEESPGSIENFSTIITKSNSNTEIIAEPVPFEVKGVGFYKFHLGKFTVYIKISHQPTPETLLSSTLGKENKIVIIHMEEDKNLTRQIKIIALDELYNKKHKTQKNINQHKSNASKKPNKKQKRKN